MHDRKPRKSNSNSQRTALLFGGARYILGAIFAAMGAAGTSLDCRAQSGGEAADRNNDAAKQHGVVKAPGVSLQIRQQGTAQSSSHAAQTSHTPHATHHKSASVVAAQQALVKAAAAKCETGDYLHAIADCNHALSMGASAQAFFQRGAVHQKIGQYKEALADYNAAIRIEPTHALAHVNRGWCRRKLGDIPASIQDFTQAIFIDPTCSQAFSNRAASKVQMGDLQGAFADSNEALRLNPDAAKQVAKVVSKPYEHSALTQDKYESGGKRPRAVAPELARLNNQAVQFINNKNFPGAIKILETIVKNDPGYEYARNNLSIAYNNFGLSMSNKYPLQSINQFRTALFFAPNENTTRDNLDSMLRHVGQDPRSADVREQLGDELRTTGDLKAAFVEYTEALRMKNDPGLRKKLAQVLIGLDGPIEGGESVGQQDEEPTIIGFGSRSGNVTVASARRRIRSGIAGDDNKSDSQNGDEAKSSDSKPADETKTVGETDAKPVVTESDAKPIATKSFDAVSATPTLTPTTTPPAAQTLAPPTAPKVVETAADTQPADSKPISDKLAYEKPVAQPDAFKSDGIVDDQANTPINPIGTLHLSVSPAAARPKVLSKEQRAASISRWEQVMKTGVQELDRGNYPAAEVAFSQAVSVAEQLNNDSFLLVRSLDMLTTAVMNQGRLNEAANAMKRALKIRETTLLPDHPEIARSYERYARLLAKTGNRGEAAVYENRAAEIWKKRSQDDQDN